MGCCFGVDVERGGVEDGGEISTKSSSVIISLAMMTTDTDELKQDSCSEKQDTSSFDK